MKRRLVPTRRRPSTRTAAPLRTKTEVMGEPARPAQLRKTNQRLLLHLMRKHSPCSRADLARISGLAVPTVTLAVSDLIERGLVEDGGEGVSSGGRPPAMLRFNASHGYVAAADIGGTYVRMMLADLNGNPVAEWEDKLAEKGKTPRGVIAHIRQGLDAMMASLPEKRRILHITAGAPGMTDIDRGVVLAAPNLSGWNDVPFKTLLERDLNISAGVDNDVNLASVGEFAEGVARGVDDFIFIAIGTGVGAGIFLRGALHRGANWSAGEIGYLPVVGMDRQRVRMRDTGQLERVIGGEGVELQWKKLLRQVGINDRARMQMRATQIFDLALEGDTTAEQILENTSRVLADALSSISLLFNPELIVLGGGVGAHPALCSATDRCLRENDFALPRLRSSSLGTKAQLFGAIAQSLAATETQLLF